MVEDRVVKVWFLKYFLLRLLKVVEIILYYKGIGR